MKRFYHLITAKFMYLIRRILSYRGYSINFEPSPLFLINVFNTNYNRKVLVSYIIEPFKLESIPLSHSAYTECYTVAKIFNELKYNVDVIDWTEKKEVDYNQYDIIFGMGEVLERVFYSENSEKILKISYPTGCSYDYMNGQSSKRILEFYLRHDKIIPQSSRIVPGHWPLQHKLCDLIVVLGNNFTANTFKEINSNKIKTINSFYFKVHHITISDKNIDKVKKSFLWFGSCGLIHKGLDLLLDFFNNHSEYILHICGANEDEVKFYEYYNKELSGERANIINHGFVDVNSAYFADILKECCFTILPSVSEGGSPSLVNVIVNGGLIPVAPTITGIEMFGIASLIIDKKLSYDDIERKIIEVSCFDNNLITKFSRQFQNYYIDNYTYENYRSSLKQIIIHGIKNFKYKTFVKGK